MRQVPGVLVAYFATIAVVAVPCRTVLGNWGKHVPEYLPTQGGAPFSTGVGEAPSPAALAAPGRHA